MSRRIFIIGLVVITALIISLYRAKYGAREVAGEIDQVEAAIADAQARKSLLEAELAHMSRREWIEQYAREELGMRPARAEQFITPEDLDDVFGPPQTGEAGQ